MMTNNYATKTWASLSRGILILMASLLATNIKAKEARPAAAEVRRNDSSLPCDGEYVQGGATCLDCMVAMEDTLPANTSIKVYLDLSLGDEYDLSPTLFPSNATTAISWSSSDNDVATVKNGRVRAVGVGTCEILATTSNNQTADCLVVVTKGEMRVENEEMAEWEGSYLFTADVTRFIASEMPFDETFDMTITNKDGNFYITSMMGSNTAFLIFEGFQLRFRDNSHAEIVLRYHNCLGNSVNGKHCSDIHELNPDDQFTHIDKQVIPITRKDDGTMEMGDFNIYAFGRSTDFKFLKEARYGNVRGRKMDSADISPVAEGDDLLTVWNLDGRCIYRGKAGGMAALERGVYLLKDRNGTRKVSQK